MELGKRGHILRHPLFEEVIPVLRFSEDRSVKRFVCNSTQETIVRRCTKNAGIDDLLDGCFGFGYRPGFAKDQQIEFILRHYGLRPDEVLFVGDSLMDYEFVRDKGVRFIALRRLFEEHDFRDRGLFSVRDLTELASVWRRSEGVIHFVDRV